MTDSWCDCKAPTFTRHADGSVTVDDFPERLLISGAFLEQANQKYVEWRSKEVTFRCANATAIYELTNHEPDRCDIMWQARRTWHSDDWSWWYGVNDASIS